MLKEIFAQIGFNHASELDFLQTLTFSMHIHQRSHKNLNMFPQSIKLLVNQGMNNR
jgi:hypothetical protein